MDQDLTSHERTLNEDLRSTLDISKDQVTATENAKKNIISCSQGNPIVRICLEQACKNALMCDSEDCKSCGETVHQACHSITLNQFTRLINKPQIQYENFLNSLTVIEDILIEELKQNRNKLAEKYPLSILQKKYKDILDEVYQKKNGQALSGKDAKHIYKNIKIQSQKSAKMVSSFLQEYSEAIKSTTKQLLQLQEIAYQEYSRGKTLKSKLFELSQKQHEQQVEFLKNATCCENIVQFLMKGRDLGLSSRGLSELIERCSITQPQDMTCKEGNIIQRICINKQCQQSSLLCMKIDCKSCGQSIHTLCDFVLLQGVTKMLKKRAKNHKDFVLNLCNIENNFMDNLEKYRMKFANVYYLGDMQESYLNIVEGIYRNKNIECLKGLQSNNFFEYLKESGDTAEEKVKQIEKVYGQDIQFLKRKMFDIKYSYYNSFSKDAPLPMSLSSNFQQMNLLKKLSVKQFCFILQTLCEYFDPRQEKFKQFKLIFRASDHHFQAEEFHKHCDNIQDTLTIIRTEFGKTIAGFTHYEWNKPNNDSYVKEKKKKTFLLQLDDFHRLVPTSENNLIECIEEWGPCFGCGDLAISDDCNQENTSFTNISTIYNTNTKDQQSFKWGEGLFSYEKDQKSYQKFCGAVQGNHFRVVEYEVFKICLLNKKDFSSDEFPSLSSSGNKTPQSLFLCFKGQHK